MQFVETRESVQPFTSSSLHTKNAYLIQMLITGTTDEIMHAAEILAGSGDRQLADLVAALSMGRAETRRAAAWILGEWGDSGAELPLISALSDPDNTTRLAAIYALGRVGGEKASSALEVISANSDGECSEAATRARRLINARSQVKTE